MKGLKNMHKVKHMFNCFVEHGTQVFIPSSHFLFEHPIHGKREEERGLYSMIFLDRFLMEYLLSFLPPQLSPACCLGFVCVFLMVSNASQYGCCLNICLKKMQSVLKKSGLAQTEHSQTSICQMDHFVKLQRRNMVKELKIEWNVPKHTALFTICMSPGIL